MNINSTLNKTIDNERFVSYELLFSNDLLTRIPLTAAPSPTRSEKMKKGEFAIIGIGQVPTRNFPERSEYEINSVTWVAHHPRDKERARSPRNVRY
jgi:hypothetical protein